jgi:hypothetical protein
MEIASRRQKTPGFSADVMLIFDIETGSFSIPSVRLTTKNGRGSPVTLFADELIDPLLGVVGRHLLYRAT